MAELRCYQHNNCEDRPAVAKCSQCGKGLCRECADNLRSNDTGKLLCVECLNNELMADAGWALNSENRIKKELRTIKVGFIIGIVICAFLALLGIVLATSGDLSGLILLPIAIYIPAIFSSFGTIIKEAHGNGFLWGILIFIIAVIISPVISIKRYVKRKKDIKRLNRFVEIREAEFEANNEYARIAGQMNTRLENMESFRRRIEVQYSAIYKNDIELKDKKIKELCESHAQALRKQAEDNQKLSELSKQSNELKAEKDTLKKEVDEKEKIIKRLKNRQNAQNRSVDGKRAA